MRFAIMETVVTPGGHEIDFDRILVDELTALGHEVSFYVPEGHHFKWDYGAPVHRLPGKGVSYQGAKGLKKWYLAAKRERHRHGWYQAMYEAAQRGEFDAMIVPSATYRYLRGVRHSVLKHSPVPVLFLIHGVTPKEAVKLNEEAAKLDTNPNLRIGVQTFAAEKLHLSAKKMRIYAPPNYLPRDLTSAERERPENRPLTLGFFGQYRREKNVEGLLEAFSSCEFTRDVHLIVQGATQTPADRDAFHALVVRYADEKNVEFIEHPLIGPDWQRALVGVDTIVMPYGNDRYLYHTAALISNAMGYKKTILVADNVNPEILAHYDIGMSFHSGDNTALKECMEQFVNTYDEKKAYYESELARAYQDFSPVRLAENIVALAKD